MPLIEGESGELLSAKTGEEQGVIHTHYTSGPRFAVSLYSNPELDDEYNGKPIECPLCEFEADYPEGLGDGEYSYHYELHRDMFVCDYEGCGWDHESETQVKSHYTREHINTEDNYDA